MTPPTQTPPPPAAPRQLTPLHPGYRAGLTLERIGDAVGLSPYHVRLRIIAEVGLAEYERLAHASLVRAGRAEVKRAREAFKRTECIR